MASRRLLCGVLVAWVACSVAWADDKTNELEDDSSESSCEHDPANAVLFPFVSVWKSNLRRVRPESPRRPPRHRRDACSMAWRCRFLTVRRSQRGHVIAEK
jgi:hypothetical protein